MEFANHRSQIESDTHIREAKRSDADKILRLLQTAVYKHLHVDWYLPGDWLGMPSFVVLTDKPGSVLSQAAKFVGPREKIYGCLAAASDVPPIAWVRVAALTKLPNPRAALAEMMIRVEAALQAKKVQQLAWLAVEDWPRGWFEEMGFYVVNEIETYVKEDTAVPQLADSPVQIRSAERADMEWLAEIEANAFEPLWQHSVHALHLAYSQALSFDVALFQGEIAGFQLSVRSESGAHLVRLTVDPEKHGQGVGSALLAHALTDYHQKGLKSISLNTQLDNLQSQALYKKFGFRPSGLRLPVWLKEFAHE